MQKKTKTESVEEFLARGGKIVKLPSVEHDVHEILRKNNVGPVTIMTLEEADLFYGESKSSKLKKQKTTSRLDLSALPEALIEKFLTKLRDEVESGEEDEE